MATYYVQNEPHFELDGIALWGSFEVRFISGKWDLLNFRYKETEVTAENIRKLAEASKSGKEVTIKFGNGEGKVKINLLDYDPQRYVLKSISLTLTDWVPI